MADEATTPTIEEGGFVPPQAVGGSGTATGKALANASGEEKKRLDALEDRGSTVEIAGGDEIQADYVGVDEASPIGRQAEKANFSTTGSVNDQMVASPAGLVPVGSVTDSPEAAEKLLEARREKLQKTLKPAIAAEEQEPLTEAQVARMTAADLRAVARDRGYNLKGEAGARTTRRRFLQAQAGKTVEDKE